MKAGNSHRSMLGWFFGSLVVCVCTLAVSTYIVIQGYRSYSSVRSDNAAVSAAVFATLEDAEFLSTSDGITRDLQSSGKIGKGDRLEWVNALEQIAQQLPLNDFHFELTPAEKHIVGALIVERVDITIRGMLLHDGLMETFFSLLAENISSAYSIRGFEAVMHETEGSERQGGLDFVAEIGWYSILIPEGETAVAGL